MILRPFRLRAPGGGILRGQIRFGEGPPPRSAVVLVHGFKGYADWGFLPYLAQTLASEGHAVATFDFSRNGVPEGEKGVSDLETFALNTYSRELDELNWMVGVLASGELTPTPPRRTGILGFSRGGAIAILAARESPGVSALVTWAAVDHLDRWSEETVQEWREEGVVHVFDEGTGRHLPLSSRLLDDFEENRDRLDLSRAAGEISAPWLIVHGREDRTVSWREGESLACLSRGARFLMVEEAGHCFEAGDPFPGATPSLRKAVEGSIRHFGAHLGS